MSTRRRPPVVPIILAAIGLLLGLPGAATSAPAGSDERAVEATATVRAPGTKAVVPSGHFKPADKHPDTAPRPTMNPEELAKLKAQTAAQSQRSGNRARQSSVQLQRPPGPSGPLAPPATQGSFEGLNPGACCARPPDTHGAVGLNHFVEVTNTAGVGVFSKSGTKLKQTSLNSFFGYTAKTIFDPRVLYDSRWNRWVIVATAFQESSTAQKVFVAVSSTSDPTGGFYRYQFDPPEPAGDFFDFPQLGMDQDAVIITANIFSGNTYVRSRLIGLPKSAIYNGKGFSEPYFNLGTPGTVAPPNVLDKNANAYLVAATDSTHLRLFRATGLGRSNASVVTQADVVVPSYSVPPDARQPGTTNRLDTLDARFQNNSTQVGNALLNVHTVNDSGFPTPRWYQINTSANNISTSGAFFEAADSDDFNPHIVGSTVGGGSSNPIGRMFFTWSSTDAVGTGQHQARVKGSGRLATDSTNLIGGTTFTEASTFYNPSTDGVERWGDYSAVSIDPVGTSTCPVGQRAYLVNERHISSTVWGSRVGKLGYC